MADPHSARGILTFSPAWLQDPEHLVPALAYPDFDDPMYEKLRDLSAELFLPNLKLIPPDTITLLKTNPPFIESYMVGLNHEFGRELLWREYPTDERGSFMELYSARSFTEFGLDLSFVQDSLAMSARVGTVRGLHFQRPPLAQATGAAKTGDLVLTIRSELLKKYPDTLVYAQRRTWRAMNRARSMRR